MSNVPDFFWFFAGMALVAFSILGGIALVVRQGRETEKK